MKGGFLTHCGLVSLLAVQAMALALPTVASAQNPPPISAEVQKQLLHDPGVPLVGSSTADIAVVEYFDYNCPFCKALAPAFHPLVEHDRGAAVLYKEWPIFGGVSVYAAQSALAANYQGKYLQAHDALMSAPRLAESSQVDEALRGAGIDMARLKIDLIANRASIDALLMRNDAEARSLGLRGTPGVLIGRQRVSNLSDLAGVQAAVAAVRRAGSQ
ncbi:MAG TPA: DsbA family protein [Steroidobacteraceae bacterium]|jgi:protein-disulfide isomerase|nr:DsbA family protein [Steroidobacteraceae bacterium]